MSQKNCQVSSPPWLIAVVLIAISGAIHFSNAAESPPTNTNATSTALDALVADVLEHNPELSFTPRLEARIIEATELTLQRKATDAALASQSALLQLNQIEAVEGTARHATRGAGSRPGIAASHKAGLQRGSNRGGQIPEPLTP